MSAVGHGLTPEHHRLANLAALVSMTRRSRIRSWSPSSRAKASTTRRLLVSPARSACAVSQSMITRGHSRSMRSWVSLGSSWQFMPLMPRPVIDLVGWPVRHPEAWGTYFGFAGLLGGDAAVNPASFVDGPCPIWSTPLAWLQADLRGCVVLDPRLAAPILRQAPGPFQCEDVDQAQWLVDTGAIAISELLVPARRAVA
jgi:hypothetical protein